MKRKLEQDIAVYRANLQGLALAVQEGGLEGDEIVSMFLYRDAIEDAFERQEGHILDVFQVIELDEHLRRMAAQVAARVNLAAYRQEMNPSPSRWWWFLDEWLAPKTIYRSHERSRLAAEPSEPYKTR